ncbi:HAMP domain-containing sensor histidine kinase [Anaerocolumna sp. AGMB13025]|uniref:HAMP domain-containing sensor histidine kinase n=1 Tax=Anaerocolumna sp. AGMB13025 TaxID=3039116 RepID=UPI00241EA5E0|nr:HAMP domain-containing sensor histidine kinase [Anaerocolumna sp. AGMB13025]WFR57528.1 HAMP domain-containing sensor histidine kinase [Anaerocolumna sp. AGMB13025]
MKFNIKEDVRQLLIKIVLPFRRKKEEWLGKFRFSIAFRISLHYLKLLVINGAVFVVAFMMLYYGAEWKSSNKKADKIIDFIQKSNPEAITAETVNPYFMDGITLKVVDNTDNTVIYDDLNKDLSEEKKIFGHIFYKSSDDFFIPIVIMTDTEEISTDIKKYTVHFQYDLTESGEKLKWLLGSMTILYSILVYYIIKQGKKSDQKLLEPIYEMSATANRLTVNNLHSQRLNVEGTKNELKDLANVINSMLDRIEVSYESQKQFVSDASHELRTPIAVIQGYGNLLNRWGTKDEEVLLESIEAINKEAKSMQDLVEKLLFLSRHDKKTLKLEKVKFNMCHVVEEMVKETKLVTANRIIESPILEDVVVYGDKQALKQAIRVFIDNAVKYTRDGDSITILCQNDDGDCIITVSDTGMGMTRKDVDNIFERFYRSDQVRNEKIYGHGLGLSIAKLIILGHTGRIKVRSQLTKGTTFIITLPKRF